jgi:hypothetical protein
MLNKLVPGERSKNIQARGAVIYEKFCDLIYLDRSWRFVFGI